uniref:Putative microplusin-like antibacteral peptide n=1 Tax=Rhipicephalus pulchellus TaxID=72859 RepID=L7LSQ9_RHIPC
MNSRMLLGLVLVGVVALAYADHHEGQPGSVCALQETTKRALIECVQTHLNEDTTQKLSTVKEQLHCEDVYCVFVRICDRNNGTLEHPSNEFFSDAQKTDMRTAVLTCRDNLQRQASEAAQSS